MTRLDRRNFIAVIAAVSVPATAVFGGSLSLAAARLRVFRSPDCGCCGAWIAHLRESGFVVEDTPSADVEAVKDRHAVPPSLRSCHTALVAGYVIEGHVPAPEIRRLLEERPTAGGLAVAGMPAGSPGMEMGDRVDPFDVILWGGFETQIFASYRG